MSGAVNKAESSYQDQIIFAHINFDKMDSDLARELSSVRSLPTCIFIKNGKEFNKIVGSMQQDQLFKELQKLLS
jgi:thioredoxin-like negative regulator of GroEL